MPRKINIRAGEIIPEEEPEFRLNETDGSRLGTFLGLSESEHIERLRSEVEEIGQLYLSRRAQDERGPTREQRNEALRRLADAKDFVASLRILNHAADSALIDALHVYHDNSWRDLPGVRGEFSLIEMVKGGEQDEDLDAAITHLRSAIRGHLPFLKKPSGPDYLISFPLAVDELLDLYHRATGKVPTHSIRDLDNCATDVSSKAGLFVKQVVEIINLTLDGAGERKVFDTRIVTEMRRGVRRFKVAGERKK